MAQFECSNDEVLMQDSKPKHGEFIVKAKRGFDVNASTNGGSRRSAARLRVSVMAATLGTLLTTPAWAGTFFFSTGNPDGKLGALSRPAGSQGLETETADDFVLTQPTVISGATIHGLLKATGPSLPSVAGVEVEIYHVFKLDSDVNRTSGDPKFETVKVPTRVNSPSDHEIENATRDSGDGTLVIQPNAER